MTLNQLRYFKMTAETGNFRQAAEKLYISQPSLSISMLNLEKELNIALFTHQGRKMELTDAGKSFLRHAETILGDVDKALVHMRRLGTERRTTVHIGCTTPVIQDELPEMMQSFRSLPGNEDTRFIFATDNTPGLIRKIKEGQYDLLICTESGDEELAEYRLREDPLVLIVPEDQKKIPDSWESLAALPLIGYEESSMMEQILSSVAREQEIRFRFSLRAPNEDAIAALVEHQMGCAVIPWTRAMEHYRIRRCPLPGGSYSRNTCIAVLKSDSGRGEAADRFLRFLTSPAPHKKKQPRAAP